MEWCYVCGGEGKYLDKDKSNLNGIYGHNTDWDTNENRCPMYLTEIAEIDGRYAEDDDDQCLALFHRLKTLKNLRTFISEIGPENYKKLCSIFPQCGDSSGYSLDDI